MRIDPDSCAVIWDYDGTLVDTRPKNLNVTRTIIRDITGQDPDRYEPLASLDNYKIALLQTANWLDLYHQWFDLSQVDTHRAGNLWHEYQTRDTTPTPVFPGIITVLEQLRHLPQGILSQNSRTVISHALQDIRLEKYFQAVVGLEDVDFQRQKPEPDGLILCLEQLTRLRPGLVFYVGDHHTDAKCAQMGRQVLAQQDRDIRLVSIGAFYALETQPAYGNLFDHIAEQSDDIVRIMEGYCEN
ncbi:MAG: HAD family hydrolase [Fidelibacterota bacterium]|nr:MAG: HAD family hydrolase [Candidatus Neomarinimicrobiota bacterium]